MRESQTHTHSRGLKTKRKKEKSVCTCLLFERKELVSGSLAWLTRDVFEIKEQPRRGGSRTLRSAQAGSEISSGNPPSLSQPCPPQHKPRSFAGLRAVMTVAQRASAYLPRTHRHGVWLCRRCPGSDAGRRAPDRRSLSSRPQTSRRSPRPRSPHCRPAGRATPARGSQRRGSRPGDSGPAQRRAGSRRSRPGLRPASLLGGARWSRAPDSRPGASVAQCLPRRPPPAVTTHPGAGGDLRDGGAHRFHAASCARPQPSRV